MITRHRLTNNVRTTLSASITSSDAALTINKASSPYKDPLPPDAQAEGQAGVLTLMDSLTNPTKIEIVLYTAFLDNGDDTITLSGLIRGHEDTIASAFSIGQYVIQALTAGDLDSPYLAVDHSTGSAIAAGMADGWPALFVGDYGTHQRAYWPEQPIFTLGPDPAENVDTESYYVRLQGGNGFVDLLLRRTGELVATQSVLRVDYDSYAETNRPLVKMADVQARRIENNDAVCKTSHATALASSTTIDWSTHDIVDASLASNATLTFQNPNPLPGSAELRRLTMLIRLANVANPGYTITWPGGVKWPGGVAPAFNVGQNQIRAIDFLFDGTYYLAEMMRTYQL